MQTFNLSKPIFFQNKGEEHKLDYLDIKDPTGKCRTALFQLKQYFEKAKIDLSLLQVQMTENNEEFLKEIEEMKAKKEADEVEEESEKEKIEGALSILYSGGADVDSCTSALFAVLKLSAQFNGEFDCYDSHFEDMDMKDIEQLLGFYIANFM